MTRVRILSPAPAALLIWIVQVCLIHSASSYSLQGKRVIVTGSSGGIGKGIALECAAQGAVVALHYCKRQAGAQQTAAEMEELAAGSVAGIFQCDFRETVNILNWFRNEIDELWPQGFDILINNAGIVTKQALEDDDDDLSAWHETLQVNLHAPRLLSHLSVFRMRNRQRHLKKASDDDKSDTSGSVILNVSSIHGDRSNEYVGAYAVSKSALDAMTRSMAIEYAVHNIRVNAIAPGVVPVERTAELFANVDIADPWRDRIPLHKLGTVQQVADACMPLLTNTWLTGAIWKIDGGMMARANMPDRPRPETS